MSNLRYLGLWWSTGGLSAEKIAKAPTRTSDYFIEDNLYYGLAKALSKQVFYGRREDCRRPRSHDQSEKLFVAPTFGSLMRVNSAKATINRVVCSIIYQVVFRARGIMA